MIETRPARGLLAFLPSQVEVVVNRQRRGRGRGRRRGRGCRRHRSQE